MATYERLSTAEPEEEGDHGKAFFNSDNSSSEADDVRSTSVDDDKSATEQQLLLPTDNELQKALTKRKAQLVKVTMAAIVCLLQTVALPLYYGQVENFWGEESRGLFVAAKYSLYFGVMLSCLFAPMLIAMFGIKVILVSGSLSVCLFVSANFVPLQYSAIPASILSGLTMGPFFVVNGVFITNCAYRYCATLTSCDKDAIINITNGIYFTIVLSAPVLSSAIKLLFLDTPSIYRSDPSNLSNNTSRGCSPNSCPFYDGYKNELFITPGGESYEHYKFSYHRIQALLGSHLAVAFAGLVMAALVFNSNHPIITHLRRSRCSEPPDHFKYAPNAKRGITPCKVALREHFVTSSAKWSCVFTVIKDTKIILILPLFVYLGLQQGVLYNVFIKDIVGCRLDRQHVYFMQMLTGTCSALISLPAAILARYAGRFRISLPAIVAQLSLTLTMLLWRPGLDQWGVLYVVGALWGCADAVWHVVTSALIGRIFRTQKDAAYSQLQLCQITGIVVIDLLRAYLCTTVVLSIFLLLFILTIISFLAFEIWVRLQLKANMPTNGEAEPRPGDISLEFGGNPTWVPGLSPHKTRQRATLSGKRAR